jgi:hypothetical protein
MSSDRLKWHSVLHLDSAKSWSITTLSHEDVAVRSPSCSPRVLDLPVVNTVHISITNKKHLHKYKLYSMVQVGSTGGIEDTCLVELEGYLISLNSDGNRLIGNSLNQGSGLVGSDLGAVLNLVNLLCVFVSAFLILNRL